MALDINALKNKLKSFNRKGNIEERNAALWKPPEGKSVIRIVPLKENPSFPFIELNFHYSIGNKTYLSPTSFGKRDPISEFADAIIADESVPAKERYAQAKQFRPKARTYIPVIVRGEEDKGVRLYSFGTSVYKQLVSFMTDEDYGDITDPKTGRDITVEYTPAEKTDTKLPQTNIRIKPNQTPLSSDSELAKRWLTEQPNVRELYEEPTQEELSAALHKYLNGGAASTTESGAQDTTDATDTASPSQTAHAAAPKTTVSFDDIFGNDD
jgi:hypothetical protein